MRPKSRQPWSRDPTPGIVVVIAGVALVVFGTLTASALFFPAFQGFDVRVSASIRGVETAPLADFARAVTFIGNGSTMAVLTILAAAWLLWRRMRAEAVLLAVAMVLTTLTSMALKELVERARPSAEFALITVPECYSFPSGHALAAFTYFGIVAFLFFAHASSTRVKLWVPIACAIVAFGVAISRVYLGVHFVGDIIASWMIGLALLTMLIAAYVGWVTRKA